MLAAFALFQQPIFARTHDDPPTKKGSELFSRCANKRSARMSRISRAH
jgi:hypothetical protein